MAEMPKQCAVMLTHCQLRVRSGNVIGFSQVNSYITTVVTCQNLNFYLLTYSQSYRSHYSQL
jgi:hypothetical protein